MARSRTLRAVLLDVDGTLIDSNDAHAGAWVEAFARHGIRVDFNEVRRRIGMGSDKLMPAVGGPTEDTSDGQAISRDRAAVFKEAYLPHLRPFDGARELLSRLKDGGLRLVAASSAKRDELEALLRLLGAQDLLDEAASSDDADRSKPDPDIIGAALRRAKVDASEALLLGDTPYDIEAADRAGVATIALRCGGWDDRHLAGAIAIYDGPADLLANYDRSPLGRRRGRRGECPSHG